MSAYTARDSQRRHRDTGSDVRTEDMYVLRDSIDGDLDLRNVEYVFTGVRTLRLLTSRPGD
ncbi:hypothetical protein C8039_18780 [Halogeometricum sp. wsp3]|nr:hypothetical protein C8039_18780 [Halogeometricum sp. wsp3]